MRLVAIFALVISAAIQTTGAGLAQTSDDSLRIYAVNVVKNPPFKKQFTGYGIYLGRGWVITAAHVVGNWPFFTHPRVLFADLDLAATVIKKGSYEQIDLALLSVDETKLPVGLRLRRNPLCKAVPAPGMEVVDVIPEKTTRAHIISPRLIAPGLRSRFDTLIDTVENSGSGIFDAERKCLLGIVSAKVQKFSYRGANKRFAINPDGFAGYFVSAAKIADFLPPEFRL